MRFEKFIPTHDLKPYIRYFAVAETSAEQVYKVFPSTGVVVGFQYRGQLATLQNNTQNNLSAAGITGISDRFKVFKSSPGIGTVLVYFTEMGLVYFTSTPAQELFNQSVSLDNIFAKHNVTETEEKLLLAKSDKQRIYIVEQFLLSQLKQIYNDKLIVEAVRRIYRSNGTIKIKELAENLFISQSPLEKRFKKIVGTTPKKFASIVRFNAVLHHLNHSKSLTEICYENNFFDQAHFIKDFKQYTGDTPENFKRLL